MLSSITGQNRRFAYHSNYHPFYGFSQGRTFELLSPQPQLRQEENIQPNQRSTAVHDSPEETSLVIYTEGQEGEVSGYDVFKNAFKNLKEFWSCGDSKRKSPFEFRPPLDCTIYENALKCMSFTEEEARDREVLDRWYLSASSHLRERIDKAREMNHPFLKNFEKMLYETETAYRTIIEKLHNEV